MKKRSEEPFEKLASATEPDAAAPSRLKSKIYSALIRRQAVSGPIRSLRKTHAEGRDLCVFERLLTLRPIPDSAQCANICAVCHARVLAESVEKAPIYWQGCPYVSFQKR